MGSIVEKVKKYDISFIIIGSLMIIAGIVTDNVMPWVDQITLTNIETCIADMHFRNHSEIQFQECVTPDLEKIEGIQKINALTTILYSIGGVFIGLAFRTKSKSKKLVNKQDICNCGTVFRCPTHDK